MFFVGEVPRRAARLCDITYEALLRGIAVIRPGAATNDIGAAIQSFAESERCSVVRDFCGHGLGRVFHDAPTILHYVEPSYNVPLRPGMLFTVEPMINLGRPQVKVLSDGWTAVTRDRSLSAQFEHTVGVTETRRRDLHPVAEGLRQAAIPYPGLKPVAFPFHAGDLGGAMRRMARQADDAHQPRTMRIIVGMTRIIIGNIAPTMRRIWPIIVATIPTTTATATGCGRASRRPAATPCRITSSWSSCCSARSRAAT